MVRDGYRWLMERWPGRIAAATLAGVWRVELFDRAMAVAAQLFTSVVPVIIMIATWLGPDAKRQISQTLALPPVASDALDLTGDGSGETSFGVLGALFVLVAATSLSRSLTRAVAAVWRLPRPKSRLGSAWRWVAVVLALVISVVAVKALTRVSDPLPPRTFWPLVVAFTVDVVMAVGLPWLLVSGQVAVRLLVPGAVVFAVAMAFVRPAMGAYIPRALEVSDQRYGSIGVAFTYLAVMYVVSWIFLATGVLGYALTQDDGWLGAVLRGGEPIRTPSDDLPDSIGFLLRR